MLGELIALVALFMFCVAALYCTVYVAGQLLLLLCDLVNVVARGFRLALSVTGEKGESDGDLV